MESLLDRTGRRRGHCTLNRPEKKNAITSEMWVGLIDLFEAVATNPDDRVLVITGAGDGFCSGADLGDTGTAEAARGVGGALAGMRTVGQCALALHELEQADDRRGQRCRRGCGLQPRARLRPRDRVGSRPLQRDLLQARPHRRLRRVVGAAPARRHAPGEGARAARRRDRRGRSRPHRTREPCRRARSARRDRRTRSQPASRTWRRSRSRDRSGCSISRSPVSMAEAIEAENTRRR